MLWVYRRANYEDKRCYVANFVHGVSGYENFVRECIEFATMWYKALGVNTVQER